MLVCRWGLPERFGCAQRNFAQPEPIAFFVPTGRGVKAVTVENRGEDAFLVARVASGDRDALERLYRSHAVWLIQRLHSRCHDTDTVDLALQDTFVAVWKSAGSYRGDGEVAAWIWGIASRRLVDQLRRNRPADLIATDQLLSGQIVSFEDAFLEGVSTGGRLHGDLGPAIDRLDPDLRAVLILTAIDGLTTKEAAVVLGIPQGTVKTRLQRARARMKEQLA